MNIFRPFAIALSSLVLASGVSISRAEEPATGTVPIEKPGQSSDQRTALEKYYGGYFERAQAEGKDILIMLYNSSRLTPERKEVLQSAQWQEKVLSRVIPIEVDTREEMVKDPETLVPIEALLQQYQLKGGPAFMALDSKGVSYGQVQYRKQTPEQIFAEMETLLSAKKQRDELFAKAAELEVQQVKLLDQAVEGLLKSEADLNNYRSLIDQIIDLDSEDKAGVKLKYRALAGLYDAEHLLLTNQFDEGMKLMRTVDGNLLPEALKRNRDQRLIRMYFLTNRSADAEKYAKEVIANKSVDVAYKQELSMFLATRFKSDRTKSSQWLKSGLALDKNGAGAADITERLKLLEAAPKTDAANGMLHTFKTAISTANPEFVGSVHPSSWKGKSVGVILFWNGSQKSSLPTLAELAEEYKGQDVAVYAVNVGESADEVKAYAQRSKLKLDWGVDEDRDGANAFGIQHFPYTVIIGKDGEIKHTLLGLTPLNKEFVKKQIEALRKL